METNYLSLSAQVAVGTFFMKSSVGKYRQLRQVIDRREIHRQEDRNTNNLQKVRKSLRKYILDIAHFIKPYRDPVYL